MKVVDSCWVKMESAFKEATEKDKAEAAAPIKKTEETVEESETHVVENENNENICRETEDSKGKENTSENGSDKLTNGKDKKKSKKRKTEEANDESDEPTPKKKTSEEPTPEESVKFSWKSTILEIIGDKEDISLKKLRKKAVARYMEHAGDSSTREKAISRFEKKLIKISELESADDRVKRV